jgi:hypothetical protein
MLGQSHLLFESSAANMHQNWKSFVNPEPTLNEKLPDEMGAETLSISGVKSLCIGGLLQCCHAVML